MNDKRDMAAMVWGYIKSRETARRMGSYAGEVTSMHPHFAYNSPVRAQDMDLVTTKAYAGPNHLTAGIQHGMLAFTFVSRGKDEWRLMVDVGSWSHPLEPGKQVNAAHLNSNRFESRSPFDYSKEDIAHIEKWGMSPP
jgi:alcohol oxidase